MTKYVIRISEGEDKIYLGVNDTLFPRLHHVIFWDTESAARLVAISLNSTTISDTVYEIEEWA
jgi:hypothetical protein